MSVILGNNMFYNHTRQQQKNVEPSFIDDRKIIN